MSVESGKPITRREMLKWMGKRTAETAYLVGVNAVFSGIGGHSLEKKQKKLEEEAMSSLESGKALQTKYFAKDILSASVSITDGADDKSIIEMIAGAFASNVLIAYLLRNHSDWINREVGALTAASARTVDLLSTFAVAKYFTDPRFTEYGLDSHMVETNPFFGQYPSENKVKTIGAVTLPIVALAGLASPWLGRSYIGAVAFVVKSNYYVAHVLKLGLGIGDQVKELIESGKDEKFIVNFLQEMSPVKEISPDPKPTPEKQPQSI